MAWPHFNWRKPSRVLVVHRCAWLTLFLLHTLTFFMLEWITEAQIDVHKWDRMHFSVCLTLH